MKQISLLSLIAALLFPLYCLGQGNDMSNPIIMGTYRGGSHSYYDSRNNSNYGDNYGQSSPDIFYQFIVLEETDIAISTCGSNFDTYLHLLNGSGSQIAYNDDNGPLCSGFKASVSTTIQAGTYYIVAEGYSGTGVVQLEVSLMVEGSSSANVDPHNYIRTWTPKKPITDETEVVPTNHGPVSQITHYYDAFGRMDQTVSRQSSPLGKDVVTIHVYDSCGRETKAYLPFVSNTTDGNYKNNPLAEQDAFNQALYPGENDKYYSQVILERSPLNRTLHTYAPGSNWVGSSRGSSNSYHVNTAADHVRIWNINAAAGSLPASTGTYGAGKLYKAIATDVEGLQTISYKNMQGQTLLKKEQLIASSDNGSGSDHNGWLCTYYVYDDLNNLRFVIPPKAVNYLMNHSWTMPQAVADRLCYRYEYDLKGRNIIQKGPGAAEVFKVYDNRNRLVFSQDGNRRNAHQWNVTYYDALDRPVETGLYTNAGAGRPSLQAMLDTLSNTQELPVDPGDVTPLTYTYYDDYSWSGRQAFQSSYLSKTTDGDNLYAENPTTYSKMTRGRITGTKVRTLNVSPNKWLITTTYYDDKGRALQTLSSNLTGGVDVITHKYDFSGKLLSSYVVNKNNQSSTTPVTRVLTENHYDEGGRLLSVTKSVNDQTATRRTIASYSYDESGQLAAETMGSNLETLNYDYNIRGWLTGVNKGYTESGNTNHYFGMELGYDKSTTEAGTTTFTPRYDGNISGEIWKSKGDGMARKYDFSYDKANRLTAAGFNQNSSGSTWGHNTVDFSVNNIDYDANGNITAMSRHGLKGGSSPLIDDLYYTYQANSNRLIKIDDDANDPNTTLGDFHDGTNSGNDYSYDANGNLIKDLNKGISSISYNILNLPKQVNITGKGNIRFIYDASGNKLRKIITDHTGSQTSVTAIDYVDGFVYKNDTLLFFPTENGRVRYIPPYGSTAGSYVYDYFISDQLGNTRMVLTEQTNFTHYIATMESGESAKENALFYNINSTRTARPAGYPQDNTTTPNAAVARLNGNDPNRRIGPSIILKVMAGDTLQAAVRAYYKKQAIPNKKASIPAEQMLAGLIQAFTAPATQSLSIHGMHSAPDARAMAPGLTAADLQSLKQKDPGNQKLDKPKAYLNYVFFDNQLNFVEEGSGLKQVKGEPGELETLSSGKIVAKKDGYVYLFTSNESQQDVFFDNLGVLDITGPILEETHYYPFGLTIAGISQTAPLKIQGRRKFNGITFNHQEFSDGSGLELYTAYYRSLDPQIGRWWQIDPKAGSFRGISPYAAMGNNPLTYSDPNGDCVACLVILGAALFNGILNVGSQALKGNINNLGQGLEYFAVGALAGAAYVIPGGGLLAAGSIQATGNKVVQYLNGQWDPGDIHDGWDVAGLALDVGTDFISPEIGANLGAAIVQQAGWATSVSASGHFVQIGESITSGFRFAGNVEVTASRIGSRAAQIAELEAANAIKTGVRRGTQLIEYQENFVLNSSWKNWAKYMTKRGWSYNDIQQTLLKGKWLPHSGVNWLNPGNPMSIITNPTTGQSLIIDNVTKEIIQLGKLGFKF